MLLPPSCWQVQKNIQAGRDKVLDAALTRLRNTIFHYINTSQAMKRTQTSYLKDEKLVITELSGDLNENDIGEWRQSLVEVLRHLGPDTKFKILVNLHGFKAKNFEAHKKFRVVVPQLLAEYGWYVGYLRMFPEATLTIQSNRNIYCLAAAHVHQDETKIRNYAENYSMRNEGFFTDPDEARKWIDAIPVE